MGCLGCSPQTSWRMSETKTVSPSVSPMPSSNLFILGRVWKNQPVSILVHPLWLVSAKFMSLVFDILQKKKSSDAHLRHSGACLNFLSPATCQQMPIKRTLHVITFLTEKNEFFYILVSFFYAAFQWLCCALKLLILSSADGLTPLGLSRCWA